MNRNDLERLLSNGGFRLSSQRPRGGVATAYGMVAGFPIAIHYGTVANQRSAQFVFAFSTKPDKEQVKQLRAMAKDYTKWTTSVSESVMTVPLPLDDQGAFLQTLELLLRRTAELGLAPEDTCAICGQPACNANIAVQNRYCPVHKDCVRTLNENVAQQVETAQQKHPASYLLGALGAILGGAIATIPSVLTILFAERIYGILYALIPMGAYLGYVKLGGKRNRGALVITILASILSIFVMEFILVNVVVYDEYKRYGISLAEVLGFTMSMLGDGSFWAMMAEDSIQSFVFLALGIWIAWNKISQTDQGELKTLLTVMDTMTDRTEGLEPVPAPLQEDQYSTD